MLTEYEARQLARDAIRRFTRERRYDRVCSNCLVLTCAVGLLLLLVGLALLRGSGSQPLEDAFEGETGITSRDHPPVVITRVPQKPMKTEAARHGLSDLPDQHATGREKSEHHSLQDPGYNVEPERPATSIASRLWQAVTPEPQ